MRLRGLDLHQVQFTIHFVETAATVGAPYIAILPIWIINFNNEFLSVSPSERCIPRRTRLLTAHLARSSWARKQMRKTPASDVWRKASIVGYIFNRRGRQRGSRSAHSFSDTFPTPILNQLENQLRDSSRGVSWRDM